jgi:hypothetical protein
MTSKGANHGTVEASTPVWVVEPSHIEDLVDGADDLVRKKRSGRTFLRIVAYPWGVEFDIHDVEGGR